MTSSNNQCYQPHHQVITQVDQVQIYEELVQDANNLFTDSFLARVVDIKDNRILPIGWTPAPPWGIQTAPHGNALTDPDYNVAPTTGCDTIEYHAMLSASQMMQAKSVRATLYSQSIPPHYLNARFESGASGRLDVDTKRLYYMASRLRTDMKSDDGSEFLKDWKLAIASDAALTPP